MTWKIHNEDAVQWARDYDGMPFHALFCDAPYHLTTITKRFGKNGSAPAKYGKDGAFQRASKGFMGTQWDGGDVAFQPETWEAFGRIMFDGAFGMAFSASRNWHRMAVAIEDAGFIIHPTIFGWLNSQGFPKATNIAKQIQPASEMRVVGSRKKLESYGKGNSIYGGGPDHNGTLEYLEPTDEMAATWVGHRYGLQALKPAIEPIIVFQKPYNGKPIDNIVNSGAGALNIDGGRIPVQGEGVIINRFTNGAKPWGNGAGHEYETEVTNQGRWPANFILDESTAPLLDKQTGVLQSGKPSGKKKADNNIYGKYKNEDVDVTGIGDNGGASRFFFNVSNQIDEADPIYYEGKATVRERESGLIGKVVCASFEKEGVFHESDPLYSEKHYTLTESGEKSYSNCRRCVHPTVKPISLSKYLATLLLPPAEYAPRRILVPFSGVASEMIGCLLAGWEEVTGVEFDKENNYIGIAEKRLEYWIK